MSKGISFKELYRQAEDYFFKAISIKHLNINDHAVAYMTAVPVADLNMICINNTDNLDIYLNQAKQFYDKDNLQFIVNIPEELCTGKVANIFKNSGYNQIEKSVAMVMDLNNFRVNGLKNEVTIKSTDNKLNDWMLPMTSFKSTDYDIAMKYTETHKRAQENNYKLFHFSLYKQEKPISSITLSLHKNIARIDDVGTLPEFQGKGHATALTDYALSEAKKLGAIYCFIESSEFGFLIYKKLGFEMLFQNNIYSIDRDIL